MFSNVKFCILQSSSMLHKFRSDHEHEIIRSILRPREKKRADWGNVFQNLESCERTDVADGTPESEFMAGRDPLSKRNQFGIVRKVSADKIHIAIECQD
jgi:proteasome lid subunit RPN8/RPN11